MEEKSADHKCSEFWELLRQVSYRKEVVHRARKDHFGPEFPDDCSSSLGLQSPSADSRKGIRAESQTRPRKLGFHSLRLSPHSVLSLL